MVLADNQPADSLAGVDFVPAEGIALDAQTSENQRHTQKALHAVHMNGRAGGLRVAQANDLFQGLDRPGLVVHLHHADQVHPLVQLLLQGREAQHAVAFHGQQRRLMPQTLDFLGAGQHRRMLHRQDQHPSGPFLPPQMAEDGQVVRLGAPGGEDQPVPGGARRLQAVLSGCADQLFGLHGGAVEGGGIVPCPRHGRRHGSHHRVGGTGGGTVVKIHFHAVSGLTPATRRGAGTA